MVGSQEIGHLSAIDGVGPLGEQMEMVATFGEETNRGLEVSEKSEMGGRKENLHPDAGCLISGGTSYRFLTYRQVRGDMSAHTTLTTSSDGAELRRQSPMGWLCIMPREGGGAYSNL
jgi:hypothetical protein